MKTNSVIAICALTSVLVSAGTFFLLRHLMEGETAAAAGPGVPRLAGMTTDQARAVLQAKGLALVVSEKRPADAAGAGKILSQQPPAGAGVTRGELVQVVVGAAAAAAPAAPTGVKVPALTGLGLAAAEQALAAAGLTRGAVTRQASATAPAEQVLSSAPAAGQELARGAAVALAVSSGAPGVKVPRVMGKTLGSARRALKAAGFISGRVREGYDEDKMEGRVLSQSPAAGATAPGGSAVDLVVNASD